MGHLAADANGLPAVRFRQLVDKTARDQGRLDYVFNNAGIAIYGEALEMTRAQWEKIVNINLWGVLNGTTAAYEVMAKQDLKATVSVADKLSGEKDASLSVQLAFKGLNDFTPEGVVGQVPELRKLLELRQALTALKGPLGNIPAFRKKIQALLGDDKARQQLMQELGLK